MPSLHAHGPRDRPSHQPGRPKQRGTHRNHEPKDNPRRRSPPQPSQIGACAVVPDALCGPRQRGGLALHINVRPAG